MAIFLFHTVFVPRAVRVRPRPARPDGHLVGPAAGGRAEAGAPPRAVGRRERHRVVVLAPHLPQQERGAEGEQDTICGSHGGIATGLPALLLDRSKSCGRNKIAKGKNNNA